MTRLLVLDWDHDGCCLVSGTTGKTGAVVERAFAWPEKEPTTPAQAEELGKKLRDFLKANGIQPAPVVACVSRQRVLLKEIRYPAVAPREEPAIVRFQASKDLLDAPEESVLDYAPLPSTPGESRALVAVLRREVAGAYQILCRAAGLKLLALTTRPFAMAGCLAHGKRSGALPAEPTAQVAAVLFLGSMHAELTLLAGTNVLFSRSLEVADGLEQEVRRSVVAFGSQAPSLPQVLYLFGEAPSANFAEHLGATLGMPVQQFRVAGPAPSAGEGTSQANFAAAVGLLEAFADEKLPIDFVHPKEPRAPTPVDRQKWVIAVGGGVLVLLGIIFLGMVTLSGKRREVQQMAGEKADLDTRLKGLSQEMLDLKAIKEWDATTVDWFDEMKNLSTHFPHEAGFRLSKMQTEPIVQRNPADKYVARLNLTGVTPGEKDALVHKFLDLLRDDRHLPRIDRIKGGSSQEFALKIDTAKKGTVLSRTGGGK